LALYRRVGIAPNDATNKPGEFFVFKLSRFHDTMTLSAVHGQISPLNFRAQPWRRLSTVASRRFFSTRCPPPSQALERLGIPPACSLIHSLTKVSPSAPQRRG